MPFTAAGRYRMLGKQLVVQLHDIRPEPETP